MTKVKFPLKMANGVQVRTLTELQSNFELETVIGYYLNGKLATWLKDRYYEEEAEKVEQLVVQDIELGKRLCEIFSVGYVVNISIDTEEISRRNERVAKLKQITDDDEIIKNIDNVAFNQEELDNLILIGCLSIILIEGDFSISLKNPVTYIGLALPEVRLIEECSEVNFDKYNIVLKNVVFKSDKKIKCIMSKSINVVLNENVSVNFIPHDLIASFDCSKENFWDDICCETYNNMLVWWNHNNLEIVDIYTKTVLLSYKDIKPKRKVYKDQRIHMATVYNDILVIFWGEYENQALQTIDLRTLNIINIGYLPSDNYRYVYGEAYLKVENNVIGLYQGLGKRGFRGSHNVKCQYHDLNTFNIIKTASLDEEIRYTAHGAHGTVENGYAYRYFGVKNNICSNRSDYACKGLYNEDFERQGSIGLFRIKKEKIYAIACKEYPENLSGKIMYDSVPREGEICIFNIEGGKVEQRLQTEFEDITDFIITDSIIAVWSEQKKAINFYDLNTLALLDKLHIPLEDHSIKIQDVRINENQRKCTVYCNKIIMIFE